MHEFVPNFYSDHKCLVCDRGLNHLNHYESMTEWSADMAMLYWKQLLVLCIVLYVIACTK